MKGTNPRPRYPKPSFLMQWIRAVLDKDKQSFNLIPLSHFSGYWQLWWPGAPAWLRVRVPVPRLTDRGPGGQGGGRTREAGRPQQRPGREQIPREGQVARHVRCRPSPRHCKFQNSFDDPSRRWPNIYIFVIDGFYTAVLTPVSA